MSPGDEPHVGIVGSGSIGSLLAAHLTLSDHRVTVVDGWFPHLERIRDHGVTIRRQASGWSHA